MNWFLRWRSGLSPQKGIKCAVTSHAVRSLSEGSASINHLYLATSVNVLDCVLQPARLDDTSLWMRQVSVASFPHVTGRQFGAASFIRHLHLSSSPQGAAPKLKEVPVDSSEDIDSYKPADYNPSNHDTAEPKSAPSARISKLVNEIANLTLLEASDLSYILKKRLGLPETAMPYFYGVSAANVGGVAVGSATASVEEEKKPEKTNFDVKLEKFDASAKIKIIKEVRTFTSLGLKEAKELVEKLPAMLKRGVTKEEAEQIVDKLKAVGATVVLE